METKVLIIDDDEGMRNVVKKYIDLWGYIPFSAKSVETALQHMKQHDFQVIITDKNMPSPENGVTGGKYVIDHVRKNYPSSEVIMMTGFASIESAIDAMKAGAFDYIVKPFQSDELKRKVDRVVEYKKLINPANTIPIYKSFHTAVLEIFEENGSVDPDKRTKIIKSLDSKIDSFFRRQKQAEYFTIIQQEALSRIAGYAEQINELPDNNKEVQRLLDKIIEEAKKRL